MRIQKDGKRAAKPLEDGPQNRLSAKITGVPTAKRADAGDKAMRELKRWKVARTGGTLGGGLLLDDLTR